MVPAYNSPLQRQEDHSDLKADLGYIKRIYLRKHLALIVTAKSNNKAHQY